MGVLFQDGVLFKVGVTQNGCRVTLRDVLHQDDVCQGFLYSYMFLLMD